jgi:hypothetical protein
MGNSVVGPLVGIGVGHVYFFLVEVLPASHNIDLIRTPAFCISIVEYMTGFTHPSNTIPVPATRRPGATAPATGPGATAGGSNFGRGTYNWGQGRALGGR